MLNEDFWPVSYVDILDLISDPIKYDIANFVLFNENFYKNKKDLSSNLSWRFVYNSDTSDFVVDFKYIRIVYDLGYVDLVDYFSFVSDSDCSSLLYNLLLNKSISSLSFSNCNEFYFVIKDGKLHSVGHMVFLDREEVLKHVRR